MSRMGERKGPEVRTEGACISRTQWEAVLEYLALLFARMRAGQFMRVACASARAGAQQTPLTRDF